MRTAICMMLAAMLVVASFTTQSVGALVQASEVTPHRWLDLTRTIDQTLWRHHYDPSELATSDYMSIKQEVEQLGRTAETLDDFISGFNVIWRKGPFSHVQLQRARASAEDTATYLDTMNIGPDGVDLEWRDDIAVLTVNTMMGVDTIERIRGAYDDIAKLGARALIIDLRSNRGGAFAGIPLVGHTLSNPYDAGVFVSKVWAEEIGRAPTSDDIVNVDPWKGWSISTFWRDVQAERLTRIQFQPMLPIYTGPTYVLISKRTESAAEMAAEAFKGSGRATLIGEVTAGKMLSQSMYDLPDGLQLSLPIADYYSLSAGRIEGVGVSPDIATAAADALDVALARIAVDVQ